MFVPVVDSNQKPLMPTTPARARRWIESGKATPFWKKGVFCVRLNQKPSGRKTQTIAVGIDPGSKREGFSVVSRAHAYLHIQATAVDWVKDAMKVRKAMRKNRRNNKTPYRANRINRKMIALPPSTKARWQWKIRLATWLTKIFPICRFVVEEVKARSKGEKKWDMSFSPIQRGKNWFVSTLGKLATVSTLGGWETKELRDAAGFKKSKKKLAETFTSHCVDSFVLAKSYVGGSYRPDNKDILVVTPLKFHRRQLHMFQPSKGGVRKSYGGMRSLGLKRGSLVRHKKYGVCYVGGTAAKRITLHSLSTGERLSRDIRPEDCKFLAFNSWRWK